MIDLKSIKKGKELTPPKILIYGVEGIGKSSGAATWPAAIVTQTEDRLSHVDVDKFPLVKTYDNAIATIKTLLQEKHDYKTHVTDTADALEKLVHQKVCADAGEDSIVSNKKGSDLGYGRGYVLAENLFRRYLDGLEALRNQRNMTIILVAHSQIKRFDDPMRESYDRYQLNVHERINAALKQWCDCVLFAQYEVVLKSEDRGFGEKDKKAVSGGRRLVYTEERPSFDAKNSYNLPFEIDMPIGGLYNNFIEHYKAWAGVGKKETNKKGE